METHAMTLAPPRERAAGTLTIEAVFRAHFDDVYRMVGRLLGPGASPADVDDVTQQVFLAAHRGLRGFRGDSKLTTWLYGIATRTVLTNLRGWRRHRRLKAALEHEMLSASAPRRPDDLFASRQRAARVWRCLMEVAPKKRIVYVLHELEGRPGAEIAELLSIPEATVWTRLHHARRELLDALRRAGEE